MSMISLGILSKQKEKRRKGSNETERMRSVLAVEKRKIALHLKIKFATIYVNDIYH